MGKRPGLEDVADGRLGVGVLWRDSSTMFLCPEQNPQAGGSAELRFTLPDVREAGDLVFRGWTPGPITARVTELALHAVEGAPPLCSWRRRRA